MAFYPFFNKKIGHMPLFPNYIGRAPVSKLDFIKIELCPIKLKKKKNCMELEFREIEFQNAIIGLKNDTIGLKNVTIGLPEFGMGRSHL